MKKEFKEKIIALPFKHKWFAVILSLLLASLGAFIISLLLWWLTILQNMKLTLTLRFLPVPVIFMLLFWHIIYFQWKFKAQKWKSRD